MQSPPAPPAITSPSDEASAGPGPAAPAAPPFFGFFPPEPGVPAHMTFLLAIPVRKALDEIESYATEDEQALGLLQDTRFIQNARGVKLMKRVASPASPPRARLLEIVARLDREKAAKKTVASLNKARRERAVPWSV